METSYLWTTSGTGDGSAGGYTQANWLAIFRMLFLYDMTAEGVAKRYLNALAVTNPSGRNLQADTGGAIVAGFPYVNSSAVTKTLTHPTIGTTGWRLVLRAGWAAQTVRVTLIESADGVTSAPAATQNDGVTWDVTLATGTITTGDVVAITDARTYLHPNLEVATGMIANNAITDALLRQSAGLSVVGRSANSTGNVADITAASDGQVLRRSGTSVGFGTIATAGIADNAVTNDKLADDAVDSDQIVDGAVDTAHLADNTITDAKIGLRALMLPKRQGNSGNTSWGNDGYGTDSISVADEVLTQCGNYAAVISAASSGSVTITFPQAYPASKPPIVLVVGNQGNNVIYDVYWAFTLVNSFKVYWQTRDGSTVTAIGFYWLAIGPE